MKNWIPGRVTLACDALKAAVKGKKIALMMNTSALTNDARLLLDVMIEEKWAEIPFLFGMEHGVRGDFSAGDSAIALTDQKTGLPVVNLYDCKGCIPPAEKIREVDAVVFCAQDVGVRHWTYTPWMMALIKSCAEAGRDVIVLDRPNPIRGDIVEGCCSDKRYWDFSLLSGFDYPLRHGMTIGELALMYNDEKKIGAALTVLPMENWTRDMWYEDTGLVWLPPSPNMPTVETALFFAATGLMQASNFYLGLGTTTPFRFVGGPQFDGDRLAAELNSRDLDGVYFVQKYYLTNCYADRTMRLCNGVMLCIHDRNVWRPVTTQLHIMDAVNKLFPEQVNFERDRNLARLRMGTHTVCDRLARHESLLPVVEEWQAEAEAFDKRRRPWLLY